MNMWCVCWCGIREWYVRYVWCMCYMCGACDVCVSRICVMFGDTVICMVYILSVVCLCCVCELSFLCAMHVGCVCGMCNKIVIIYHASQGYIWCVYDIYL